MFTLIRHTAMSLLFLPSMGLCPADLGRIEDDEEVGEEQGVVEGGEEPEDPGKAQQGLEQKDRPDTGPGVVGKKQTNKSCH